MNPSTRLKLIRDWMQFGEKYTARQLYRIYTDVMSSRDALINQRVYEYETIRDQLRKAASGDGWLIQEDGLFYKREPQCYFVRLHDWLIKLTERVKEYGQRRKD